MSNNQNEDHSENENSGNIGVGKNRSTPGVSHPPLHFHKLYDISFSLPDQNNIG